VVVTTYEGPVTIINTSDNSITTIRGAPSTAEAVGQDGMWIYIGHTATVDGAAISVLSIEDTQTLAIPGNAITGLVVSPDGCHLYAAASELISHHQYDAGWLVVIDTATFTVLDVIAVGVSPNTITLSPDGSRMYVTHFDTDSISVVDLASRTVSTIALPDSPLDITVAPDGTHVYVTNCDSLAAIDTATNSVEMVAVGSLPRQLRICSDGKRAYLTNFGDQTVSVIDTLTNTVAATVLVGGHPEGMEMNPGGGCLYVTDYWARTVTVISIPTVMTNHSFNGREIWPE
jgi:YVTN family beta-propeller protein